MTFWSLVLTALSPSILYPFLESIPSLIREFSVADKTRDLFEHHLLGVMGRGVKEEVFDFIIVGSGSSGSLLAHRLSKDFRVLVLEAGGQPNPLMDIPGVGPLLINKPETDWMYQTVPQRRACFALRNQTSNWPRGKMEGGTSNINALIYLRGHVRDYDNWASLTGNPIWSYNSLVDFFKKFENFVDNTDPDKGHEGELIIEEYTQTRGNLPDFFVQAGLQAGYPKADLNSNYTEGFDTFKFTKKKGRRWEAYSAFLLPAKNSDQHDLTIYKYSTVTKVLIDALNRAYGVEYVRHGVTFRAKASKEVILAAGAINSPQLLMLSGVGPKKELARHGIPVKVGRVGVGKNLQDHFGTYVGVFTLDHPLTFKVDRDMGPSLLFEYITEGTGPLSSAGIHSVGVISTKYERQEALNQNRGPWPDIQLSLIGNSIPNNFTMFADEENIQLEILERFWNPHLDNDTFQIFIFPTRPVGRGEILLANKDPMSKPIIDPKYLEDQRDVNVLVEGIKVAVEIIEKSTLFQSVGAKLSKVPFPTCVDMEFRSDAYWECYLRQLTLTLYHASGTCAMGRVTNPEAVVDPELRVIGVKNARVIDASIIPAILSSNINAACNVIAEVGAHLIKRTWMK